MSEEVRIIQDIQEFVHGNLGWEMALNLISRISQSEEWIDYLLNEMESLECDKVTQWASDENL
jgi:hypothetical protein